MVVAFAAQIDKAALAKPAFGRGGLGWRRALVCRLPLEAKLSTSLDAGLVRSTIVSWVADDREERCSSAPL
jgi:hypothetical protein